MTVLTSMNSLQEHLQTGAVYIPSMYILRRINLIDKMAGKRRSGSSL